MKKAERVYVASSWKNPFQFAAVQILRKRGFEVYDFRQPAPGNNGFRWTDVMEYEDDPSPEEFLAALSHPVAEKGFYLDMKAMNWADTCLLVLPCGRSAHLEAGWFAGQSHKRLVIVLAPGPERPDLMYKMADAVVRDMYDALIALGCDTDNL